MTTAASALADTSKLPDYEGRSVARTMISVKNAGDGLSEGLAIDPQVLAAGSTVYVVLECVVDEHKHKRLKDGKVDTGMWVLNQVLQAGTGTLIDADVVKAAIVAEAEKIRKAQEEAQGIRDLFADQELTDAHGRGEHAEKMAKGCPACESEKAAAKAEADKVQPIGSRRAKKDGA